MFSRTYSDVLRRAKCWLVCPKWAFGNFVHETTFDRDENIFYPHFSLKWKVSTFTLPFSVIFLFKLQTQPPNLPKHDIANSEFHACIKKEFRFCEDAKNQEKFGFCILRIFEHCLINQRHLNNPDYRAAKYFLNFCLGNKSKHPLHLGLFLLKCYKNHPKRHF